MINFSVAICTYNGELRLPEVLAQLRCQINIESLDWEIIVIDNNSTDNTAKVVQKYQLDWSCNYPLKYCFEQQQGLASARQRAILEAQGEFVAFLDDDNIPTSNWVAAAYNFGKNNPQAGAYGGQIHGDFEVKPSDKIKNVASYYLALVQRGSKPHIYSSRGVLPPGAGLVIRRQAWIENVPQNTFLKGRLGKSMLASEDLEVLLYIQKAGWEIWYNPEMLLYHKIPRQRLEREYLIPLVRGIGLARHHIRMIRLQVWQRHHLLFSYIC